MSRRTDNKSSRCAHRHFMARHWKEIGNSPDAHWSYSPENITRMKMGKAPRRLAVLESTKTGETIEFHAPLELHHVFGINDRKPDEQTVLELYPWQHAQSDESRHFPWSFVRWIGYQ